MPIKYVEYKKPKSSLEKRVVAQASSYNVKGDWLNGVPTIYTAQYFLENTIDEYLNRNRTFAYHNRLKVINEVSEVYVEITGAVNGEKTKLCGFINE